ncbi:hypothetical protein [Pseudodesulfovibrio sp.]|uniref:hypothetical protein n=1 Tax=Pseudodesulfovibrio sp. TaxID=2035812 RepID=UPI00260D66B5|nr:hypothetical protein [Pseudodesulfovibrio sp.]MDD3312544.1 hypothetical protein [Pseudodesulfovibrio sp.]
MAKLIKTTQDHEEALARVEMLMTAEQLTPQEEDELELLVHLIEKYEEQAFPIDMPSPVEAILFRMDQLGLRAEEMLPYFGTKSRVSEVLNGKRELTLQMMRALNAGLNIPAEVLLQNPKAEFPCAYNDLDWSHFPLKELARRGVVEAKNIKDRAEESIRELIEAAGYPPMTAACHRQGSWNGRNGDRYATFAWELVVRKRALEMLDDVPAFSLEEKHLCKIAHLSVFDEGPLLAKEYLAKHGVILIIEPQLKQTYLDGIALLLENGTPVVGLTLRHDRIDYFWFTLLHELVHILKHLSKKQTCIWDIQGAQGDIEEEANTEAANAFIPPDVWAASEAKQKASKKGIIELAKQLDIHVAIVAGRVRNERKNYRIHAQMVGNGEVKKLFI